MADAPQEPVGLAEVKARLKDIPDGEDALLASLITAAREQAEAMTGLVLVPRIVVETAAGLGPWIDIAAWPVAAAAEIAIAYLDAAGAMQDVAPAAWRALRARRPIRIYPIQAGWGIAGSLAIDAALPVTVSIAAGYADGAVPEGIKNAILLMVAHWYANREAVIVGGSGVGAVELPLGVDALLRPYRVPWA